MAAHFVAMAIHAALGRLHTMTGLAKWRLMIRTRGSCWDAARKSTRAFSLELT